MGTKWEDERMNRRQALFKLGALGVATSAGLAATYKAYDYLKENSHDDQVYEWTPAGDTSHPIRQEDVNREYNDLYKEILAARDKADREHKKLSIVMGEVHYDTISFLHETMILDIASRLGIKDAIIEQPKEEFADISKNMASIHKLHAKMSGFSFRDNPELRSMYTKFKSMQNDPHSKKLCDNISASVHSAVFEDFDIQKTKDEKDSSKKYKPTIMQWFCNAGFTLHCGDPERYDDKGNSRDRYDKIVEGAMVQSILNQKGHSIAVFGGNHQPPIVEALRNRKDTVLLAYDVSNSIAINRDKSPIRNRHERPYQVQDLIDKKHITCLKLDGKPPCMCDVLEMAFNASLAHRTKALEEGKRPELSEEDAKFFQDMMKGLRKERERVIGAESSVSR